MKKLKEKLLLSLSICLPVAMFAQSSIAQDAASGVSVVQDQALVGPATEQEILSVVPNAVAVLVVDSAGNVT